MEQKGCSLRVITKYELDDTDLFYEIGLEYLFKSNGISTVKGLCEYLGISKQTLHRYKKRNDDWYTTVSDLLMYLKYGKFMFSEGYYERYRF